ncbi:MAG TPA: peptidoglycan bridge formation glycyltransferase FemA/FemB family protein [Candidatus Limnocylindrales bacterium]
MSGPAEDPAGTAVSTAGDAGSAVDVGTAVGATRRTGDAAAWDAFVEADPRATYLQATAWAAVKAANGWRSRRVVTGAGDATMGGQVLLRRPRVVPWSFGYAPRGPIARRWDRSTIGAWTEALRVTRWGERVAQVRIDPEIEADGELDPGGALRADLVRAGWRPAASIQPPVSRVVDLRADEAALWSDLRTKWRQYVNKARSGGVTVVDVGEDRLAEFHAILTETARRAGTRIRAASAYRDVWDAFRPAGRARLLLALGPAGDAQAALLLVRSGDRVVEPYGGMTAAGALTRANYLVKWEAIRSSREAGATAYDMWGLVHPGIRQFKAGFGGREIAYIGGWELALDPLGAAAYRVGAAASERLSAMRAGRPRDGDAATAAGTAPAAAKSPSASPTPPDPGTDT